MTETAKLEALTRDLALNVMLCTDSEEAIRLVEAFVRAHSVSRPAVKGLELLDPKDDEAFEWVTHNLHGLRRDDGMLEYTLVAVVQAYQAGKASSLSPPTGEWRPIESAPRDGTRFLAFGSFVYEGDSSPTEYQEVAAYSGDEDWPWEDAEGLHHHEFFSHWQPLPSPPEAE